MGMAQTHQIHAGLSQVMPEWKQISLGATTPYLCVTLMVMTQSHYTDRLYLLVQPEEPLKSGWHVQC